MAKKGAPKWSIAPFEACLEQGKQIDDILVISMRGISALRAMPKVMKVLMKVEGEMESPNGPRPEHLELAEREAQLATTEVDRGFPLLHAHAAVALWGSLEVLVEDFLVAWLANTPDALRNEALRRIKIPLAEYESLEKEDRLRLLVQELERSNGCASRQRLDQFEAVFHTIGLSGTVEAEIRRDLIELQGIRNVIVHRGGKADGRLVRSCPWMGLKEGDNVSVTHDAYSRYQHSVASYVTNLIYRLGRHFGADMDAPDPNAPEEAGTNTSEVRPN